MSRLYYSMNEGRVCVLEKERGVVEVGEGQRQKHKQRK